MPDSQTQRAWRERRPNARSDAMLLETAPESESPRVSGIGTLGWYGSGVGRGFEDGARTGGSQENPRANAATR